MLAAGGARVAFAQGIGGNGALAITDSGPDLMLIAGAARTWLRSRRPAGLLLVDGGAAAHAAALQHALAERWPGRPVEILFNTNWREEHTGANAACAPRARR